MLVHLRQYDRDDATESLRSDGTVDPDRDPDDYFGEDDLEAEEWERVSEAEETLLSRSVTFDGVTAVSVPRRTDEESLPGRTLQLRVDGEERYLSDAEIVEVQDANP